MILNSINQSSSSSGSSSNSTISKVPCYVIPLGTNTNPSIKEYAVEAIQDKAVYRDEFVIPCNIIDQFNKSLNETTEAEIVEYYTIIEFDELRLEHQKTSNKIQRKNMGEYGQGGFTAESIDAKSYVAYTGRCYSLPQCNPESRYNVMLPPTPFNESCTIDSSRTINQSRFFQHLPDCAPIGSATANLKPLYIITTITIDKKKIKIPMILLYAPKKIPKGVLVGFDYSLDYFTMLREPLVIFSPDGKVLYKPYLFMCPYETDEGIRNSGFLYFGNDTLTAWKNKLFVVKASLETEDQDIIVDCIIPGSDDHSNKQLSNKESRLVEIPYFYLLAGKTVQAHHNGEDIVLSCSKNTNTVIEELIKNLGRETVGSWLAVSEDKLSITFFPKKIALGDPLKVNEMFEKIALMNKGLEYVCEHHKHGSLARIENREDQETQADDEKAEITQSKDTEATSKEDNNPPPAPTFKP